MKWMNEDDLDHRLGLAKASNRKRDVDIMQSIFNLGQVWRSTSGLRYEIIEVHLYPDLPSTLLPPSRTVARAMNMDTGLSEDWKADKNLVNWHLESSALA